MKSVSTILIVEDERITAKGIDKQLRGLGYVVAGLASTGEEAIRKATDLLPDLILMDIHLGSGIDGVQAAELVRKVIDVPVVFLTAHSDEATLQRTMLIGPHGYVLKPYDDKELRTAIELGLHRHKTEQRLERCRRDLEATNARLELLASTDALTELKNRRAFQDRLAEEVRRANRFPLPLSVLLLDVDHFKQFNDVFGHSAGDDVLKTVARLLEVAARSTDFVSRYGGEEFALILPNTDPTGAMVSAERIRRTIACAEWTERVVTVSIGAATLNMYVDSAATLIRAADSALYRSKRAGRNCVSHANEPAFELEPMTATPTRFL